MLARFGLEREMTAVESRLGAMVASREPHLEEVAAYVVRAGGKRLRPFAVMLAYRAVGGGHERLDDALDIATGLELIHNATLVHDDINDGATMRRGQPAAHRRYGIGHALIAGDFLFTQGFRLSGRFEREVIDWTADACQKLAEGEFLQARFLNDPSISLEEYLTLVERKTACLIATGIRIGAHLGGASPEAVDKLYHYGLDLGIAFQIIDDVLDVDGDGNKTGKRIGIDIREGNPTIPSILTIERDTDGSGRLVQILRSDVRGPDEVDAALDIIRGSGALEAARRLAADYGERAKGHAAAVRDPVHRARLIELVDLVLQREV